MDNFCPIHHLVVYYESMKRELDIKPIYECGFDERLKTKVEEDTHLTYAGLIGELEHLKIKTRLIHEKFPSVMGECDLDVICTPSKVKSNTQNTDSKLEVTP
jgi:hypothetical protein